MESQRKRSVIEDSVDSIEIPTCKKHSKRCVIRKVMKRGKNHGRRYFSCPIDLQPDKSLRCGFFKWLDVKSTITTTTTTKTLLPEKKAEKKTEKKTVKKIEDPEEEEEELNDEQIKSALMKMVKDSNLTREQILKYCTSGRDKNNGETSSEEEFDHDDEEEPTTPKHENKKRKM